MTYIANEIIGNKQHIPFVLCIVARALVRQRAATLPQVRCFAAWPEHVGHSSCCSSPSIRGSARVRDAGCSRRHTIALIVPGGSCETAEMHTRLHRSAARPGSCDAADPLLQRCLF